MTGFKPAVFETKSPGLKPPLLIKGEGGILFFKV